MATMREAGNRSASPTFDFMRLFRKPPRRRSFSQREMFQFEALEQRILLTNTAPNAVDDQYGVLHDFPLVVEAAYGVLSNDWDDDFDFLTASLDTGPQNGTLHFLNADGSFYYEPDYRFVGVDSFTYTVSDGQDTATATVTINVGNTPPVANDDTYDGQHRWSRGHRGNSFLHPRSGPWQGGA